MTVMATYSIGLERYSMLIRVLEDSKGHFDYTLPGVPGYVCFYTANINSDFCVSVQVGVSNNVAKAAYFLLLVAAIR